jgi:hypothetical protein
MFNPPDPRLEGGFDRPDPQTERLDPPQPRQVVVVEDEQPAVEPEPRKRGSGGPKWETEARERVKAGIRRFTKPLKDLIERDANEGDTRMLVNRILTDVLGYDEFGELTTEYSVKGEFADYGIRIDRDLGEARRDQAGREASAASGDVRGQRGR